MPTTDRMVLKSVRAINSLVSEGPVKNRLRMHFLRWRNALPRELMIGAGQTAVQVGMWRERNVGRLCQCVGPTGRVILIEANRENVERLQQYSEDEGLTNLTIVHTGAWHEKGQLTFHLGSDPSDSRLDVDDTVMMADGEAEAFAGTMTIDVDTVDNILSDLGIDEVDYIEISVNGAELDVLRGMENTLKHVRRVFCAGYARSESDGSPKNREMQEFLQQHGYQTTISRRARPTQGFNTETVESWGDLEGHVFAWRP